MRQSLRAAALLLLAFAAPAAAQRPVIDEGTLLISRNGTRVGRESFRIQVAENGRYLTATAQAAHGETRLTPALSVDSASGMPVLYRIEVRAGSGIERLQASGRPGRLSAVSQRAGGEAAKEYVLTGNALILDEDTFSQYALLPILGWTGRVTLVIPRRGEQVSATIADRGMTTVRVDGRGVTARHLSIDEAGGRREAWYDREGRLLKVSLPGGVEAIREELPR